MSFESALKHVLVHEGGYINHPRDPGGETNKGITKRVYEGWRKKQGLPIQSVRDISSAEIAAIYKAQYWDAVRADELPVGVDYVLFDGAVNSGPKQSVKWLQRALGVNADGEIGAITLGALEGVTDYDLLIARIIDRREAFLRALKTWATFGKGWMRRINEVERIGQAEAKGSVGPNPTPSTGREKARVEDAKPAPNREASTGAATGGVATGGVTVAVERLQETITPYSAAGSAWIDSLVVVLAVAATVLTIGGIAWRLWQQRKANERKDALDLAA